MSYEGNPLGQREQSQKDLREAAEERGNQEMEKLAQEAYGEKK